jgi:hypothetical protein
MLYEGPQIDAIALLEKHIVYTQNSLMSAMRKSSR